MHGRHTFYPFTLPLQVCTLLYVCQVSISGASPLVLNGTLGQSVTLLSGFDEKNYSSSNITLLFWKMNTTVIMQFLNKNWSALKSDHFKDRLTVNTRDGSLTISQLKGGDEGEYVLSGFGSAGNLPQQRITLHVLEETKVEKDIPNIHKIIIIAAAAGGGALGLILLVILICCCLKKKNKKEREETAPTLYAEIERVNTIKKADSNTQNNDLITCYDVIKDRKCGAPSQTLYDTVNFNRKETSQYQEVL
nr:PREDICTED: natural killer cell receptor 2B4 isoform X2 [Lepisosteus oculatus]